MIFMIIVSKNATNFLPDFTLYRNYEIVMLFRRNFVRVVYAIEFRDPENEFRISCLVKQTSKS